MLALRTLFFPPPPFGQPCTRMLAFSAREDHKAQLKAWKQFKWEVYVRALEILKEEHGVQLPFPPKFVMPTQPLRRGVYTTAKQKRGTLPPEAPAPELSEGTKKYFFSIDGPERTVMDRTKSWRRRGSR